MIYQRAREAIAAGGDPVAALRTDQGIRSILESTAAYGRNVTYAAVVDNDGIAIAHSFPAVEGQKIEPGENLAAVLDGGYASRRSGRSTPIARSKWSCRSSSATRHSARFASGSRPCSSATTSTKALQPMLLDDRCSCRARPFWSGLVLAGRILRPIHVINSGLMKLGRGEKVGSIDLPPDEELEGVGESFKAISEKLASRSLGRLMAGVTHEVRNPLNAMTIHLELVREHLLRQQRNSRAPVGAVLGLEGGEEPTPEFERRARAHRRHRVRDQAARRSHHGVRPLHPPRRAAASAGERRSR